MWLIVFILCSWQYRFLFILSDFNPNIHKHFKIPDLIFELDCLLKS